MESFNLAAICGVLRSEPRDRELPSGSRVTNLEVTVRGDAGTQSVPVVVHDRVVALGAGEEIIVIGHVARRFFRAGGTTQSRTEVVAATVTPTRRKRSVQRALEAARDTLEF